MVSSENRKRIVEILEEEEETPEFALVDHTHTFIEGPKGEKGEKGDRGIQGIKGDMGIRGEKGERGERGIPGARGEKGDTGDPGQQGMRGERGLVGATGEPGEIQVYLVYTTNKSWVDKIPHPEVIRRIQEQVRGGT